MEKMLAPKKLLAATRMALRRLKRPKSSEVKFSGMQRMSVFLCLADVRSI